MAKKPKLDDDTKRLIKQIVDHFDNEDRSVRDRQIRTWRRLKLLWENMQNVYYSEVAHDWRIPESDRAGEGSDQGYYDKPVNIYRAYLESIIAALSVSVPSIICYPDDADNPLDISTAKAGDKISELVFKHNNAPLLWLHALFVFCTEGMTACYTYPKEDTSFGTWDKKHYSETEEHHNISTCPNCQAEMDDQLLTPDADADPEKPPDLTPDEQHGQADICPNCGNVVQPVVQRSVLTVTNLIGITKEPKSRVIMEVYGGLFVKVPVWARNQQDCAYLIYSYETHYANVLEKYPDLRDDITSGSASYDLYEQWGRTSPQYKGEHPINNVTVRNVWLRPSSYNILNEDEAKELRKKYPTGLYACVVNEFVADAEEQKLDDYWTLTYNPMSDYIHFDPLGLLLTSVQDITNDLVSLVVQTVEHGIPQTFADPKVLNFDAYRNSEVIPGGIYPATPKSGKSLSDGFYEVRTATLSQEVLPFAQKVQELGQMVSGALPSLFGGQMAGSRTASEYSMSRAQALQRLQTTWKMLTLWWKEVFGKVIPLYIAEVKDDEKQVKRDEFGNFTNVFIRKAELEGKIGSIELEANENLPITWNQQKDSIMELFKLQNDVITQGLISPENIPYLKRVIGLSEYSIAGEDDRQKQYEEIQLLAASEPIPAPPAPPPMMGQPPQPPPQPQPSIDVDIDVDNHGLEADICRAWLVSDAGRLCKQENPNGYQNVLLHLKAHKAAMAQLQAQQQPMPPPGQSPAGPGSPAKPPTPNAGVPMKQGAESVPTTH
jgi:hypothetical protein